MAMWGSRSATPSGVADFPRPISSMQWPSQAASIRSFSMPGVGEALLKGLDEELLGPHIPALPEVAAPHPEYRHLIPDSTWPCPSLLIVRCRPLLFHRPIPLNCHPGESRIQYYTIAKVTGPRLSPG